MKSKAVRQLGHGVTITSLSANGGRGEARLRANFRADGISADVEKLSKRLKESGAASLWFGDQKAQVKNDNFNFENIGDVLPNESDFILVPFRALSKRIVERGHYLDFTTGDVLKNATPLLVGQTLYPNHELFDVNNALGSIASAEWDEAGEQSGGIPGINAVYKVDALMNPRIARLLLMKPPAIHSTSLTILFEFQFSHEDLAEQGRFWDLLGEEVDGEIVRLIVTAINDVWEASFVYQGGDSTAKQIEGDDDPEDTGDFAGMRPVSGQLIADRSQQKTGAGETQPPNSIEERTMKLTTEEKAQLGIEFDGEDVPETELKKAGLALAGKVTELSDATKIAELENRAKAGDAYVAKQREEVTRLARLVECKADDNTAELPEVVAEQIAGASFDTLVKLEKHYSAKVAEKFPKGGRSSQEDPAAAGAEAETAQMQTAGEDPTAGLL